MEVNLVDLAVAGLSWTDFTPYSYIDARDGRLLYLEEDSDMGKFMEAYKAKTGEYPELVHSHEDGDSFIRLLDHLPR